MKVAVNPSNSFRIFRAIEGEGDKAVTKDFEVKFFLQRIH